MSELSQAEKSITDVDVDRYAWKIERGERICLIGLLNTKVESEDVELKRQSIVERLLDGRMFDGAIMECSIGGCDVSIEQSAKKGKVVSGECKAIDYCLKEKFEESGRDDLPLKVRKDLYRDIMDTCMGRAGSMSAGEFCPKIECGLSAGFSIDGNAGTAGECIVEVRSKDLTLDI